MSWDMCKPRLPSQHIMSAWHKLPHLWELISASSTLGVLLSFVFYLKCWTKSRKRARTLNLSRIGAMWLLPGRRPHLPWGLRHTASCPSPRCSSDSYTPCCWRAEPAPSAGWSTRHLTDDSERSVTSIQVKTTSSWTWHQMSWKLLDNLTLTPIFLWRRWVLPAQVNHS